MRCYQLSVTTKGLNYNSINPFPVTYKNTVTLDIPKSLCAVFGTQPKLRPTLFDTNFPFELGSIPSVGGAPIQHIH